MVVITEEVANENVVIRSVPIVGAINKVVIEFYRQTNGMAKH